MSAVIILIMGFKAYLLIQIPIIIISHIAGLWLFYIQHQFDDVSWEGKMTGIIKMPLSQDVHF